MRRVMQESTVTIEEVEEDEVVDLIGMFNSYATSSRLRMVKEVRKRPCPPSQSRVDQEENDEASEEGMPKKYQRESILFYATQGAQEHSSNGVDMKTKK